MPAGTVVLLGASMTLLCGLMQNAARLAAREFLGQPLDHGVHAWWTTPLGDAVIYVPLVLLLLAGGRTLDSVNRRDVVWTVLWLPFFLTGLLLVPRLHDAARLVLAFGLALRAGALAARWTPTFERGLVRRSTLLLASVTLTIAVPLSVWPLVQEHRDESALAAAPPGAPNVLLLIWDTVRASSLGLYGNERPTAPLLSRLAEQGVVFDWAIATASYTLPSHSSLLTGRWAHELSSSWRTPLNDEPRTLAEVLASAGYRTGAFSANRIYVTREYGLGRGFAHFEEHRLGPEEVIDNSTLARTVATSNVIRDLIRFNDALGRVPAERNHAALVRWLDRDRSHPWFAFVNFMEGHLPYLPSERFATRFGWYSAGSEEQRRAARALSRHEPEDLPPEKAARQITAYEGAIAELDEKVGALLSDLRARGLLDNTIIVVAADHGEEFGEHALFGHGNSLYLQSLRVPLVVVFQGRVPPRTRVRETVSLRSVAATVLDLAGQPPELPGGSLRPLWERSGLWSGDAALSEIRQYGRLPDRAQSRLGGIASGIGEGVQVIRRGDGAIEAYDLAADPTGVARADTTHGVVTRIRDQLPPRRQQGAGR